MPWSVSKDDRCPASRPWGVVKQADGSLEGCHVTQDKAKAQQAALYASESSTEPAGDARAWTTAYINDLPDSAFACIDAGGTKDEEGRTTPRSLRHYPHHDASGKVDPAHLANARARVSQAGTTSCGYSHLFEEHKMANDTAGRAWWPPRDNLVRVERGAFELRDEDGVMPTLTGRFAVFNQWTTIHSISEGHFMERIAPGAFRKAFADYGERIKVLFQHGKDPTVGDKVLGIPTRLEEDEEGALYEVPLLDTSYNRDLIPGLRAGAYGASFRFSVMAEEFNNRPKASAWNPDAIPERTVKEAAVAEFGPVTFPAYLGATAGIRSATDEYNLAQLLNKPEALIDLLQKFRSGEALPTTGAAAEPHPEDESRPEPATIPIPRRFRDRQEYLEWISSISTH